MNRIRGGAFVIVTAIVSLALTAHANADAPGTVDVRAPEPTRTALAASGTAADLTSAHAPLAAFDGRWNQRDAALDERSRFAAIEAALEPLNWVVRKMAGGVLRSTTAPPETLVFVWDGRLLQERVGGARGKQIRPVDPDRGPLQTVDSRGEAYEADWSWTRDGLEFSWRQHQAFGSNLYQLDPTRGALTIVHTIRVTAIEGVRPIVYRSRFDKESPPAVAAAGAGGAR